MAANTMTGASPQYLQASLPSLPEHIAHDETTITAHLASRFHAQLPTAQLSSHGYICVNNFHSPSAGINGGEEGSSKAAMKDLATRAYARVGYRKENQAVVFLGDPGSGKSTLANLLLSSILSLSGTVLSDKLSYANFVFTALTGTKTATSLHASKAGLYFELQYDSAPSNNPILLGGKILDHRLERSRVTLIPPGERNFHIFYYLRAGLTSSEKAHLGLDSPGSLGDNLSGGKRWRYLGHPSQLKAGIEDDKAFTHFKNALRKLEFGRGDIAKICEILAAILHIGQLEFFTTTSTSAAGNDSGGFSHEGGEDVTAVKNRETLGIVAAFLGVSAQALEESLGHKTKMLRKDRVTVMLDPAGARANADELARTLYTLLVAHIIEVINVRVCCANEEKIGNTIALVDFPGFAKVASTGQVLDQLLNNAACEHLYNICLQNFFDRQQQLLETEEVQVPASEYYDNADAVKVLNKTGNGLLAILDDQTRRGRTDFQFLESIRRRFENKNPSIVVGSAKTVLPGSNFATQNLAAAFTIKHYEGEIDYPINGLVEANAEVVSGDMMNLLLSTRSDFVNTLLAQDALTTVTASKKSNTVMQASVASKPRRMPSMARRKYEQVGRFAPKFDEDASEGESRPSTSSRKAKSDTSQQQGVAAQFLTSLVNISNFLTDAHTNSYFVFCLKLNERRIAGQFDSKVIRAQLQDYGIADINKRLRHADFSVFMPFGEFVGLTGAEQVFLGTDKERVESYLNEKGWRRNEAAIGLTGVFLSERRWLEIANIPSIPTPPPGNQGLGAETDDEGGLTPGGGWGDSKLRLIPSGSPANGYYSDDKHQSYFGARDLDGKSEADASAVNGGDMFRNLETREQMAEKAYTKREQVVEEFKTSGSRKRWLFIVYAMTWWIPDFLLRWTLRQPRKDVRMAWREKLAINMLIWLSCAFVVFFMIGMPELICPRQYVFSTAELSTHNGKNGENSYIAMRGIVYDLDVFMPRHYPSIVPQSALKKYAGIDATALFPVQVSALCNGVNGSVDPAIQLNYLPTNYTSSGTSVASTTDPNSRYHDFRWFTNDSRPDWWWEQQYMLKKTYMKGNIGYTPQYVKTLGSKSSSIAIINSKVYDLTKYIAGGRTAQYPAGTTPPSPLPDTNFMDQTVVDLFQQLAGQDVSKYWDALTIDSDLKNRMLVCLDNLFYVGDVDTRNSTQCLFAKYILLAISILLVSVIGFKFLAALQFGGKNLPENLEKFVICQIPAYTEDEESLRRAIDSAARMRYDDKRKLLVIICDGFIIGNGNDRPTPRIVLDILGVPESVQPEPLSFESLGEGLKQHNKGKVYTGLYEVQGHIVPFLVIVKVGRESEVNKPGNRGKRDSQMILMRFLNRVHYNLPMTPLELEMHHQIRNIIGVNPTFYEYLLQIDADTVVAADSATRMIGEFVNDTRLIGVCGETSLTNAKESAVTMMQVYEYYISHNLTKAFESLFGSVTCLPGCFSMYRIRASDTGKPLFVSKEVVEAYSTNRVDTLHMKNLLHLGEDRYLTTLLLKHHSKFKTKYLMRAHAWTIAPNNFQVFLSQRRRWINSTVHNLIELIPLSQLCGFCCFSMRFVVFIDLLSTVVQPVIIGYIVYLIVLLATDNSVIPITAFLLLGAIYGLQAIIFIVRRKWEMIGWMLIYMLATPIFSFALPLYAFWYMDDFSWGSTRIVTGDKGQKVVVSDEGKFDPSIIPRKRWEEYQAELLDSQTQYGAFDDTRSEISGLSYGTKSFANGPPGGYPGAYAQAVPGAPSPYPLDPYSRPPSHINLPAYNATRHQSFMGGSQFGAENMELMDLSAASNAHISDDQLLSEIRDILSKADLMKVTKKQIKKELEARFGVDLTSRKVYISEVTEAVLTGQL